MSINANGSIKELRVGATVIKEARVGSTVVFTAAWPAVPADGVIWSSAGWGSGIGHSKITTASGVMTVAANATGTITGVVFSPNTTRLTVQATAAPAAPKTFTIDGITLTRVSDVSNKYHYDIPESLRTKDAHTITLNNGSNQIHLSSMSFNI